MLQRGQANSGHSAGTACINVIVGLDPAIRLRIVCPPHRDYRVTRLRRGPVMTAETIVAERLLPGLERRLKAEMSGGVDFGRFTRGRYATDASHYQIMPFGVVTPTTIEEAERAVAICRAEGVPVTPRGGGSSQAGQTVNESVIVDCSKHLNRILDLDVAGGRVRVEPGIVLDKLNRQLRAHGLWFPVDVS